MGFYCSDCTFYHYWANCNGFDGVHVASADWVVYSSFLAGRRSKVPIACEQGGLEDVGGVSSDATNSNASDENFDPENPDGSKKRGAYG